MTTARQWGGWIALAILCFSAGPALAQGAGPGNRATSPQTALAGRAKADVERATKQLVTALLKGDASYLERDLADDYVSVGPTGEVTHKKDVLARLRSGDLKYDSIEVKDQTTRVYGDAAVTTATVDVKGKAGASDLGGTYRVTRVWAKREGRWRSVSFQSTRVAAPAADATPAR